MKINFSVVFSVVLIGGFLLIMNPAMGQEEGSSTHNYQESGNHDLPAEDKAVLFEQENKAPRVIILSTVKDTANVKSTLKPKVPTKPESKNEEDALSFNFLYYIIQKYKISDIIDQ